MPKAVSGEILADPLTPTGKWQRLISVLGAQLFAAHWRK
jgi:hypothetical protein